MGPLIQISLAAAGLVNLICFVLVLMGMWTRGKTTLAIVCIVLTFFMGIGVMIAFVYGWMNSTAWRLQQIMLIWSGAIVAGIVLGALSR